MFFPGTVHALWVVSKYLALKNEDEVVSQRPCALFESRALQPGSPDAHRISDGDLPVARGKLARTCGSTTRFSKLSKEVAYGAIPALEPRPDLVPWVPLLVPEEAWDDSEWRRGFDQVRSSDCPRDPKEDRIR